jgi:hypothetical protein
MVVSPNRKAKEDIPPDHTMDNDDSKLEVTAPSRIPPNSFEDEMVEIYIRHEIKIKQRDDRGPHLCHIAVL